MEAKLSEGGMGVVYRARDTHLDRPVAIKVLRPEAVADPERKKRFVQEAKAASSLNHPNILTIYDIDTAAGVDFIAMEYVPGKTLDAAVGRKGLSLGETLKYAVQIADALTKAHAAGIVHRDIKPSNIMITDDGLVKVLDFGLAKLTEPVEDEELAATRSVKSEQAALTEKGTILGTVAYMSPEQAEGKAVDARSDIFSFGAVLYEILTGRRPFQGETRMSTLSAILRDEPKPLSQVVPGVPRELERVIARCLRKDPRRRFQDMADLKVALEELKEESESGQLIAEMVAAPKSARRWIAAAALVSGVAVLAAAVGATWWLYRSRLSPTRPPVLTRLTYDSGLTTDPALSPDGKLLAYASDRSGEGNLDIWEQQTAGGEAIRLTHEKVDAHEPAFSPDGGTIAFRSEREGGGIYVISALGGEPRLIAKNGRRPRFSPDGSLIAYSVGTPGSFGAGGSTYLVASTGGQPRQLHPEFYAARFPLWSPDGDHILFEGIRDAKARYGTSDWWVTTLDGRAAAKTGFMAVALDLGLLSIVPEAWIKDGNQILFSARLGDSANLWHVSLAPKTWQVRDSPQRLTFGSGLEGPLSIAAGGRLAFSGLAYSLKIWGLPIKANEGKITGPIQQLTRDAADDFWPSISEDGKKLVFISQKSGNNDVWIRNLESGRETALTATPPNEAWPIMRADGSKVVYAEPGKDKTGFYMVSAAGGVPEKVCDDCGRLQDLSPDGKQILYHGGSPSRVTLLEVPPGKKTEILRHADYDLYQEHFSSDSRWITFLLRTSPDRTRLFIVPFRGTTAIPENQWIAVTDGLAADDKPRWSPDGNLLYFTSERDGFRCIWAQRLDATTKHPAGPPFAVYHSHSARRSLLNVGLTPMEISVARDKIVFSQGERTGNIWMAKMQ